MIRKKLPDKAKAQSIVAAAERNMLAVERLAIDAVTGPLIATTIYESFRMLGDALLTAEGFEVEGSDHHAEMIGRLTKLNVAASRSVLVLDELRKKRNKINYDGYLLSLEEVMDILAIKAALWEPLLAEVSARIKR